MNLDVARGLLAGEAMHPANVEYRIHLLPPKRLARMEVLHAFDREHGETTPTRPYVHSTRPEVLQPGPGENLEWFVFAAQLLTTGSDEELYDGWLALARAGGARQRPGTRIALANLLNGLRPPQSGHDNPHYFDDLAMVRGVAAAVVVGSDEEADRLAASDAHVTHDLDGVWCAVATSRLVRALIAGADPADAVERSLEALPDPSWSRRLALTALETSREAAGALDRAERLGRAVADWIYSYPIAAPETLALLLAHTAGSASADELLLGAFTTGRSGTTLAALAGAVAAARFGTAWIPEDLRLGARTLTGIAVPALAGTDVGQALLEVP